VNVARQDRLRRRRDALGERTPIDGLLVVDKAPGPTSHAVVLRARACFADSGAGHLGTLDPAATGLLLIAMGAATRCISVLQGGDKTYEAGIRFGVITTSQDLDGEVLETRPVDLTEAAVREASARLVGTISQIPPMVSALKHRGERLHAIARRGETVEREPRTIEVRSWEWLSFAFPEARFRVRCSGGTYVRTLAHDLGQALGCGAALASLRRLRSEPFDLERSVSSDALESGDPDEIWSAAGIPLEDAIRHLPFVTLTSEESAAIGHGRAPRVEAARMTFRRPASRVVLRDPAGHALALAEIAGGIAEGGSAGDDAGSGGALLQPRVVFPWAVREGRA